MGKAQQQTWKAPITKVSELIRLKGHRVHSIPRNTTLAEAARAFLEEEVGSFLVQDGDQVVGIFTKNDLVRRIAEPASGLSDLAVGSVMTTDLFTTTPDADLEEVFGQMVEREFRHVPVLQDGKPVGMITSIDILLHQKKVISADNEDLIRYILGSY